MRFLGAVIKPVHPCTGLIARFAQQNALLLRTTDIRVGTEKKTPREQNSSGKKIGVVWCSGADRRSFEASAVLHFVFFEVIVNKMQHSAKENCLLKRNTAPEVFPLTAILAGSGKTMPFEKRHAGCEEREKINRRRIFDTLRINFFEATKQTACIFSKGDGNMTKKMSTTNLPGARGNAYPKAELDYSLDYEYDPAYAHRLIHAGNRYYRYDANGNITAEKDGPFTEDDEFIFTYNYDPDTDVYGTDYGFGLDAPKETEETHPENLFAYRRNYTWNEKNLLTKSSDRTYTVHYRYGEDGQRALKYTEEGRSETLYFNNFYTIHIPVQDKNNPQGLRVHKHIFVGNSRLVTAMTHTDNNSDNAEQREKRYYYHSDHLGSAQFVTDWRGKQYEHIEDTPYGELWIEEVAAGLDKLPFRFTGKEMDEETGLYYYGARYLDPKYSRWLSGDPALGDYIPKAPIDDEAKKHNENLPGMGGVFNVVNLHLYHYAGNNPVKYEDPTGLTTEDGAEVTVIIYYDRKDQKEFKKAAETAAKSYSNQDNTYLIGVYTADDFKSQWSLLNAYFEVNNIEVDNMEVFCHGNAENLYFKGSNLSVDDVNSLDDFSFSKNAQLILHSCNSGTSDSGISQAFANKENITESGQTGYANFSSKFEKFSFIFFASSIYLEAYNRTKNNPKGDGTRLPRRNYRNSQE